MKRLRKYEDFVWYEGRVWRYDGQYAGVADLTRPTKTHTGIGAPLERIRKVSKADRDAILWWIDYEQWQKTDPFMRGHRPPVHNPGKTAMKAIWIASYGPDRSHDTLYSEVFGRQKDARAFVKDRKYWRVSRMEYTSSYSPGERTDEIGGVDVDREIEKVRIDAQYRTGRRVSEKEALALWRKRMRERHGPGGAWRR